MAQEGCRRTEDFKGNIFIRLGLDAFDSGCHIDLQG